MTQDLNKRISSIQYNLLNLPQDITFSTGSTIAYTQRYKYNDKEFDEMHGLHWYDYGARHYDPAIMRFTTIDPMCEKYYHLSPYAYCGNNPVNAVDVNGDSIYIGYEHQEEILRMINEISEGVFDVDENGFLILKNETKPSIYTGKYSKYYRDQLIYGINTSNKITISLSSEANYKGKSYSLEKYGQGLTITDGNEAHVYISGMSHMSKSGSFSNPNIILAHELAGHAIPSMSSSYNNPLYDGLAVTAENIIRGEIGLPLRTWGEYENKHHSVNSFINPLGRIFVNKHFPIFNNF